MSDEFVEETFNLDIPQQQNYNQPSSAFGGGQSEEDRLNKHIKKHEVGPRGQALLQSNESYIEPQVQPKRQTGVTEHWADLHKEFGDILDVNELQKFRRHFRAFGEKDGYIDANALHETMETFFGQDLDRKQIQETIAEIDYDNDGKISYREFLEVMCGLKSGDRNRKTKFGNFYKVLTLKNPPFWNSRIGRVGNI